MFAPGCAAMLLVGPEAQVPVHATGADDRRCQYYLDLEYYTVDSSVVPPSDREARRGAVNRSAA